MAKAAAILALLCAALLAAACSPFGGVKAFTCTTNEDCSGGTCEADSLCSFADAACDSGRRYGDLAGGQSNQCVGGSTPDDAPVDQPVIPPEVGDICFGAAGGLDQPCFSPGLVPAGTVALTGTINTTTDPLCSTEVKGTADCVIAGASITLAAGTTVNVTGSRALILVATNGSITIEGILNAASKRGGTSGPKSNDATCGAGTAPGASAGGAGGSFGALGGNGGNGNTVSPGGVPGAVAGAVTALRGGCRGQDGTLAGTGGDGGGAVYLIATTSIALTGAGSQINVSGASATGALPPDGGAAGAGSGGLIGLDAPTLTNQGTIFAKGGGGGEGSGNSSTGNPGADPGPVGAAAGGTGGSGSGGDGGIGGVVGAGNAGGNSANGGGGGGGGGGVIRLFGGATAAGTIAPAPS